MKNKHLFTFTALLLFLPLLGAAQNLIPQPAKVAPREGTFAINPKTVITYQDYPDLADYLNQHIERAYGYRIPVNLTPTQAPGRISLACDPKLGEEAYFLQIAPEEITLRGGSRTGVFYALQTLFQLMSPTVYGPGPGDPNNQPKSLACITIEDAPRYPYRGVMLDISRTFFDKETVLKYLDWMSRHKINKFHWHLSDDDGWRIEIKKYPDLTEKGAWRGPSETTPASYGSGEKRYGGFYTQEDIKEVVRYAAFRGIEVIPEIDLPGHSKAARSAYPEIFCKTPKEPSSLLMRNIWCAGREENYDMIRDILTEVAALFPSPYIHIGGDEVNYRYWRECPHCQAKMRQEGLKTPTELQGYFMSRLEKIANDLGKRCGAWNEVTKTNPGDTTILIYGWENTDACREALAKGYDLVAMPAQYCYIDMKQSPFERGHTWAYLVDARRLYSLEPGTLAPTAAAAKHLRGVECAQFAELMGKPERFIEYQGYPRICALSEVGWSQRARRDWEDFYTRLTVGHFPRLAAMGISFRVFPPEATFRGDTMSVSSAIPNTTFEYTTDPDPLQAEYQPYTGPIVDSLGRNYLFRANYAGGAAYSPGVPAAKTRVIELAPGETRAITLPLKEYVDRDGVWYLAVVAAEENTRVARLEVKGPDTTYTIIGGGQRANPFNNLRLYVDRRNRTADAILTLTNNSASVNRTLLSLRPSPYLEPAVKVTASFPFDKRFPANNLSDYNLVSYARSDRGCQTGDYVLFTFDEAIACRDITLLTGLPNNTRYIVTQGTVDYSADGVAFTRGGTIDDFGEYILYPKHPVKAVRIRIHGSNGEIYLALQDLRIRK